MVHVVSVLGFLALPLLAWGLSTERRRVQWRTVAAGLGLQLLFGVLIFLVPPVSGVFLGLSNGVVSVLEASKAGTVFCFGPLAQPPGHEDSVGFVLAFQGLATIVFFAALVELLYHIGVMPLLLKGFSRLFTRLMRVSGAESLCASSTIFVGIESATTVRPFLKGMTRSELCTVLTAGLATIASSMLGMYVFMLQGTFPQIAAHLISASLLSAPAAIVMSKLLMPETGEPETMRLDVEPHYQRSGNCLEALLNGANAGARLVVGVVVMLLAFLGLVELINMAIGFVGGYLNTWFDVEVPWSLQQMLSYVFYPFALLIGVPPADAFEVATLLGERAILTEIPAYQHLNTMIAEDTFQHPRSAVLAGYALCGFTHVASIAVFVGGIAALAPNQSGPLTQVAFRAFLAATFACLMTACVAGIFYGQGGLFLVG